MNNYIVSSLSTSFTTITLALFVFFKNRRRSVNRIFALYTLSIGIWSYGFYKMITAANIEQGFFWSKALHIGALFIPTLFLHFVLVMIGRANKQRKIIITTYIISFTFLLICPTKLFISTPVPKDVFTYFVNPGLLYYAYTAFFFVCIVYTHYELFRAYRKSKGIKRNQIKYLLLAYWIGYTGGATAFFPLFNIHMPSLGLYTIPICMIMIAWIILRYHLMDITLVFREMLVSLAYSVIVGIIFMPLAFLARRSSLCLGAIIITLIITAPYIHKLLAKRFFSIIDTLIFKRKYDYIEKLEKFIEDILGIHKEEDLFNGTAKILSETLSVRKVGIFTIDNISGDYIFRIGIGLEKQEELKISGNTGITVWLKKNKEVFVKEEMEKALEHTGLEPIKETLSGLEATVCVPVLFENELVGIIILGEKSSGDMYSHIDTEILHHIGTQLAFALNYRRKEEELRREKELATIGIMTAEISHQMRNLLVMPTTFINLAPQRRDDNEFFGDFRKLAEEQIVKLGKKLEYISIFGRSVKLEYAPININQVLENILTEYSDMFKDIIVVKEFSGLPLVRCDGEQIKLVFGNIIINSIEAMQGKPGGKIRVRTRINENPAPEMRSLAERWIRVEIKDDGPGMNAEMYNKRFTPFVTTKSVGGVKEKGAGLGLAIAKKIVDLHKGAIDIRSSEGKGTTAIIDLSVQLKEEPKPPASEMDAGMPPWLKELKKTLDREEIIRREE